MTKRIVDKRIMTVLKEYKGHGFRFGAIFHAFARKGTFHNQSDIWKNLVILIEQKKIVRVKGYTRPFYGIPLVREDGSKYLIINQGIEDETIEVEE